MYQIDTWMITLKKYDFFTIGWLFYNFKSGNGENFFLVWVGIKWFSSYYVSLSHHNKTY